MSDSTPSQPTPEPNPESSTPPTGQSNPTEPSNPSAPDPSAPAAPAAPDAPEAPVAPPTPPAAATPPPGSSSPNSVSPDSVWQPVDSADTKTKPEKRSGSVGIIAALAIGALIGGVSGAGVYAVATNNADRPSVQQGSGATNITVNDPGNATTVTAVAASAAPSVVTISVAGEGASGTGSGVVLTKDGYILTNAHVATLSGATSDPTIKVQTSDGHLYDAKLIGSDPIADLAVVKVDAAGVEFQPAKFADSSKLNVGDTVVALGAPLGLSNTVTSGIVSALNRSITVASSAVPETQGDEAPDNGNQDNNGNGPFDFWQFDNGDEPSTQAPTATIALPVIQTDAAINPGNSGGALLDSDGRVIGINVAIASTGSSSQSTAGSIGVGFAIPANLAKRISDDLIKDGAASHGLLGASVRDVTEDETVASSATVGSSIWEVTPGGAADKAGLRKGDVVIEFNGMPITGKTDLTAQVRVLPGGADAELVYVRAGKTETVTVTLGEL